MPLLKADVVATVPAGYFSINIAAGAGSSAVVSLVSFPLQGTASAPGQVAGTVTGITANTITNASAGWTTGGFSQAASPYLIQFTSGAAKGRTFLISRTVSNTATTVTLDAADASLTDLTTLGIVPSTDSYQILPADTLSAIFGTPDQTGVLGGSSSANVDQVQLYSPTSGWAYYYYKTNSGWTQVGPPIPSGNTVVRPDTGIIYLRYGTTPMTLTLMGRVPNISRQAGISNSGITVLSNNWPTDTTLATSNISQLTGWVAASSYLNADLVQIYSAAKGWTQYYHNGIHWLQVGPPINSDNVSFPAGTAVILVKRGTSTGQSILSQALPYSI